MLQRSYLFVVVEGKTRRIQDAPQELPVCSNSAHAKSLIAP